MTTEGTGGVNDTCTCMYTQKMHDAQRGSQSQEIVLLSLVLRIYWCYVIDMNQRLSHEGYWILSLSWQTTQVLRKNIS